MSLVVFPFKDDDPAVAIANIRTAAGHPRVSTVLCVGSGGDADFASIEDAVGEVGKEAGVPVHTLTQTRMGSRRPGKGDAMNTAIAWFLDETDLARIHFYDADITTFSTSWISKAERAADDGYPAVRHYFPRSSTDAMITWFITRPGLAKLWPGTVLPEIRQPLGGELLFTRRVAEHLAADPAVVAQSDWGIDTRLTLSVAAGGFPTAEVYIPEGKLHKLYGSLTDIEDMAVECFSAVQQAQGLPVFAGVDHRVDDPTGVSEEMRTKAAYSVEETVGLLGEGWTDTQVAMLQQFPRGMRTGMLAGRESLKPRFLDARMWGDVYDVLLTRFDPTDDDWRSLLFRMWVARVLSYTASEVDKGYDSAIAYLQATISRYEAEARQDLLNNDPFREPSTR